LTHLRKSAVTTQIHFFFSRKNFPNYQLSELRKSMNIGKIISSIVLLLGFSSCVMPETSLEFERNPETGAVRAVLHRGWQAGPVSVQSEYTGPDGTHITASWQSDINLDAAQAVRLEEIKALNKALEMAAKVSKP
jgi:hypothetical protein